MNATEIKSNARMNVIAMLMPVFQDNNAIKYGDCAFAIPQEVDGQKLFVSVEIKCKQYKPTKVSPAFDPYAARDAWMEGKKKEA